MATWEVTRETITVHPHPNADRLELAQVGLFNVVVGKDQFKSGESVIYIPEYSVLPQELIVALGLEGKLAGSNADRIKPVRLRGELSQGVVAPLTVLPAGTPEQQNYADVLGITKWEPEIPSTMSGEVEGNYNLVKWADVENLKKFPDMFTAGEPTVYTEKIHGSCDLTTIVRPGTPDQEILVSSKGLGEQKLVLKEDERNIYWQSLRSNPIEQFAQYVATKLGTEGTVERVGVFGETFGSKVQDLHYGYTAGKLGYRVFDATIEVMTEQGTVERWLTPAELKDASEATGLAMVPVLYEGPFDMALAASLASGKEQVSGQELHIREGIVVRPAERGVGYDAGTRMGKFVSESYLLRKGGSEFS